MYGEEKRKFSESQRNFLFSVQLSPFWCELIENCNEENKCLFLGLLKKLRNWVSDTRGESFQDLYILMSFLFLRFSLQIVGCRLVFHSGSFGGFFLTFSSVFSSSREIIHEYLLCLLINTRNTFDKEKYKSGSWVWLSKF